MKKRIFSVTLAGSLVIGLFIPAASAAASPVCQIGSATYTSVSAALASVKSGAKTTISMLASATDTVNEVISGKTFTFALNGYNLIFHPQTGCALEIENKGAVDYSGSGTLQAISADTAALIVGGGSSAHLTYVKSSGTGAGVDALEVDGSSAVINGNIDATGAHAFALYASGAALVTVNGNVTSAKGMGLWADTKAKVTVVGNVTGENDFDSLYADDAIYAGSGSVVSVWGDVVGLDAAFSVDAEGGTVNITGNVKSEICCIYAGGKASVTVNGNVTIPADSTALKTGNTGIDAYDSSTVTVTGNVSVAGYTGYPGYTWGVSAGAGGSVIVGGKISCSDPADVAEIYGGSGIVKAGAVPADSGGVVNDVSVALNPGNTAQITPNKFAGYVTYTDNLSNPSGYIAVRIAPIPVAGIALNKTADTLIVGATDTLKATVNPSVAANKAVAWSSSNPAVATVDANGKITAKAVGTATVTVTAKDGGNKSATCKVTVVGAAPTISRMGGADRDATAALIAKKGWSTSDTVLLAYDGNYPDALAATPLAVALNAPILLTGVDTTPGVTMTEIKALKAKNIILLGGVGVISAKQAAALQKAGYKVTRYGGTDRNGTAQLIGNALERLGGSKTAVLETGSDFPDALVMGPYAGMNKMPMVFATKTSLPDETQAFIKDNKITKVIVVDDGNDISVSVVSKVKSLVGSANVAVITATDRYDLSAKVANTYKAIWKGGVAVATGGNFPDALTGGALAAKMGFPVLLLNPKTGGTAAEKAYVKALRAPQIYVFGGTGVVPDSMVQGLYQ